MRKTDVPAALPFDPADIEGYLASTCLNLSRGPLGQTLSVPGHSPLVWPLPWVRYLRSRRNQWYFYEESATLAFSFLIDRLRPKVVFDVGAANGYFARVAASHLGCQPVVHAFEPSAAGLALMSERLRADNLGSRVIAHQAALSDHHEGERDLWYSGTKVFEREPQAHEWRPSAWSRFKLALHGDDRTPKKSRVLLTSVDWFAAEHGVVPDLIKIDVDGYEAKVVRGALDTLSARRPAIALELHKDKLIRSGTRKTVVDMLTGVGYKPFFLTNHHDRKACRVVPVDSDDPLVARQETDFVLLL